MPATAAPHYTPPDIELEPSDTAPAASPDRWATAVSSPDIAAPTTSSAPATSAPSLPLYEPRPRRRPRRHRRHQPLRIPVGMVLLGFVLLCQVVAFLWLKGMAMSARNRASHLDRDISTTRLRIDRTRNAIAERLSDEAQIDAWAAQGHWHLADQSEIDDVTDRRPYATPQPTKPN